MSIQGVNQHLRVYVSPATAATEPTVPADGNILDYSIVTAGTGLPLGGITYRSIATVRDDATMPVTVDFQIIYKDMDGNVFFGPVIKPEDIISTDLARAAVAPTQQVSNLTIGTATADASYVLRLVVPGYGGLLGAQDEVYFYGTYTAATGDDVTAIADGLVASMGIALAKAPVSFATISNTAGKIIVTGVAQPYVQAKWSGRQVNFALSLASPEALLAGDDGDTTTPVLGNGNYNQVAGLEEFYAGYNEGYKNRYSDFPYNTEPTLAAEVGGSYTSDTITFATVQQSANLGSQRQVIQLFFKE